MQETDAAGNVIVWGYAQSFVANGDPAIVGMSTVVQENGKAFEDDGKPAWANAAGVKGVQLYADMVGKYHITPAESVSMVQDDVYDQFSAGRAVFARCSSARVQRLMDALGDKGRVGFMPTPSFVPGKWLPTEVSGWTMGVWVNSTKAELAGALVDFMSNAEADNLWVRLGGQVPMRQSTIRENIDIFGKPENAYLVVIAETLRDSSWFPPDNAVAGKNDYFLEAVQDAITNKTPPLEALQKAEQAYIRANRL
jgi:multiple sugar transport system substrate-binding protein